MPKLTMENCTAFDIIEDLGNEFDITWQAAETKWKGYFYTKDGQEYVKVFDNHVIPFIIHMRVAGIDNEIPEAMPLALGCRREIDED